MSEDRRVPIIETAVGAFNREDAEALLSFLHPDVVSEVAPGLGNPGTWTGIEGFAGMISDWGEAWSENHLELTDVELVDERVAFAYCDQTAVGAGSGVPVTLDTVFLIEFEDDRAVRFQIHPSRDSALAAL